MKMMTTRKARKALQGRPPCTELGSTGGGASRGVAGALRVVPLLGVSLLGVSDGSSGGSSGADDAGGGSDGGAGNTYWMPGSGSTPGADTPPPDDGV